MSRKNCLAAVILVLALFPHVYQLYLDRGPSFGPDEGKQVASARNLVAGLGYTIATVTTDISTQRNRHLYGWPPGYSLTLAGLHFSGLNWVDTVFFFKVVVIVLAITGWFWMACRVLGSPVLAAGLMFLVPYRFVANPTDMLCIALTPYLLIGLERIRRAPASFRADLLLIIGLSFLASVIVVFKYSAVYIVGVGFFWLLALRWLGGRPDIGLGRIALYLLPPFLLFVAIMVWNESEAAGYTWVSRAGRATDNFKFWTYFSSPFKALLIHTFNLEPWLARLGVMLSTVMPFSAGVIRQGLLTAVVIFLLAALVHFIRTVNLDEDQRARLWLLALCCLASGAFLIMMSVIYQARAFSIMYRYYVPVAPLLFLFYVHIGDQLLKASTRPTRVLGLGLLVICLSATVAYGPREYYRTLKGKPLAFDEGVTFLSENIERISAGEPRVVMGSMHSFAAAEPLQVVHLKLPRYWRKAYTTQSLWLFLVRIVGRTPGSFHYQHRFDALEARFEMEKITHGEFQLYFTKIGPGSFE